MSAKGTKPPGGYQVGYGKPPSHSRFRKGKSGNPTGKRQPNESERAKELIRQEAYRLLTIREGDKVMRIPAVQAVLRSLIASAAKGSVAAQRATVKIIQDAGMEVPARKTGDVANKKVSKDLNEMSDEELMALLTAAQQGEDD